MIRGRTARGAKGDPNSRIRDANGASQSRRGRPAGDRQDDTRVEAETNAEKIRQGAKGQVDAIPMN